MERRLAAILAADVVGYSRLMGADETGTLAAMRTLRKDTIEPLVARHRGHIVKLMGDGLLVEFASVVDAVGCALAWQNERQAAEDQTLRFRIGVNLGDIIFEEGDIHGDGVNVAARLEGLAEPGGICISSVVHDQVYRRIDVDFTDLGEQELKNIDQPVRLWQWSPEGSRGNVKIKAEPGPIALPDKPSIAVLPFGNLSGDPEQEYFSDGIAEDILASLSRNRWLFVIARNSSFVYKGKAVDVRVVCDDLGVRYVLEGSVRKAGNRVRITTQLIDGTSAAHLWAERYDRDLTDIFAVQDEIAQSVAAAIEPEILAAEGARAKTRDSQNLNAWDLVMRALSAFWRMTKEDGEGAIAMLEQATKEFSDYAPGHSMLAFTQMFAGHIGWIKLNQVREPAANSANRALAMDDQDAWAHLALGYVNLNNRQSDEAIISFSKAINLNPNFAAAYGWRGLCYVHDFKPRQALDDIELALRLSPKDPQNTIFLTSAGLAHYLEGHFDEAVAATTEAARLRPEYTGAHRIRCAALAEAGRQEEAEAALATVLRLQPDATEDLLRRTLPYSSSDAFDRVAEGLRKAGLPKA